MEQEQAQVTTATENPEMKKPWVEASLEEKVERCRTVIKMGLERLNKEYDGIRNENFELRRLLEIHKHAEGRVVSDIGERQGPKGFLNKGDMSQEDPKKAWF